MSRPAPITLFPERSRLLLSRRTALASAAVSASSTVIAGCARSSHQDVPSQNRTDSPTTGTRKPQKAQDKKPVLYLYPQKTTELEVRLSYAGELTYCYPEPQRSQGAATWCVSASPDGTLTDASGRSYPSLFWEGLRSETLPPAEGFVVEAGQDKPFLEDKLALLGLSEQEAADFITYWGPQLAVRGRCLVTFASEWFSHIATYRLTDVKTGAELVPDTFVRVFMLISDVPTAGVREQVLSPGPGPGRQGFTAVEWGGAIVY